MQLPNLPGLGFYPTNEELLLLYLRKRILEDSSSSPSTNAHIIPDIDLYHWKSWDLPREIERLSPLGRCSRGKWYFFCANHPSKKRNVANAGHWKEIGKSRTMTSETTKEQIGTRKTLVFYQGCTKTSWVVHECHINPTCLGQDVRLEMAFVVCCLYENGTEEDNYGESVSQESDSSSTEPHRSIFNSKL